MCINMCCRHFHKSTGMTVTDNTLVVSVSNSTNIASKDVFCFVLTQKPSLVITGSPIPVVFNVNGENIPVYNKYSIQLTSDALEKYYRRGLLKGYFVTNNNASYVIFNEIPKCNCK